ncbi:UPF0158 family protein [Paenibacillus oryzisoli]|uniref:UPF0158 family protein n=1 Tax=Paenibacillus oryzisoli TaxID=1850517 RepID=UPI003D2C7D00
MESELTLTQQQFTELVDTYDMYIEVFQNYLNVETGEIVTLRSDEKDPEFEELEEQVEEGFGDIYFRIPERESRDGFDDMVDFAETISNARLQEELYRALNGGKRVFRRFKDTLSDDRQELERYYAFVHERNRTRMIEWLADIGFTLKLIDET